MKPTSHSVLVPHASLQASLDYLSFPSNISKAKRAFRQLNDSRNEIYHNSMLLGHSVCGLRMEISFRFLGTEAGEAVSLESCFRAVCWYFKSFERAFSRLANTPGARLLCKQEPAAQLLTRVDNVFFKAETEFPRICRGANVKAPPEEAIRYLGELYNYLGLNGGQRYCLSLGRF